MVAGPEVKQKLSQVLAEAGPENRRKPYRNRTGKEKQNEKPETG